MTEWKAIIPHEGMRLRFKGDKDSALYGQLVTAHKGLNGWFVSWDGGGKSNQGEGSGIKDDAISTIWEVVDGDVKANSSLSLTELKIANSQTDACFCANCGGKLKEPWPGIKYCPICES